MTGLSEGVGGAIERSIYTIRGERVMLDADLARLYGVETKALNQAVRRNAERSPLDFMFVLTVDEANVLRSQSVTSKKGRGGARFAPCASTELGVAMLSSVLHSPRAIAVNVEYRRRGGGDPTSVILSGATAQPERSRRISRRGKRSFDSARFAGSAQDDKFPIARALADLEGVDEITSGHVAEAIQYRVLDRGEG